MGRRNFLIATTAALLALSGTGCGAATTANPSSADASKHPGEAASGGAGQPQNITSAEQNAALIRFAAKHKPVYCGGRTRPWVAFTFDDGPGPYTKLADKIMRHAHQPATFFVVGRNVAPNESALKADERVGPIGDHSWTHPLLVNMSAADAENEITSTASAIEKAGAPQVRLFRPPYGAHNVTIDAIARRNGMVEILWNIDSRDSLGANHSGISKNVIAGLHAGSIILMHENHGQTIRALNYTILPHLKHMNLKLVTVPQMLAGNPPTDQQLARGRKGCR